MSDFHVGDGIMRPFTYEDAVILLRNINPERGDVWTEMRKELRKWVNDDINDMMFMLEQHKDEIWHEAFPDERKELQNAPGWSSERLEALAWDIQKWLRSHDMWIDTYIYYDGKCMGTSKVVDGKIQFRYNEEPFIEEDEEAADPRNYFEYVAEKHILSMSFEGPLYEVLNACCPGCTKLEAEFQKIFQVHGCYYEMGHSWNLTCYE